MVSISGAVAEALDTQHPSSGDVLFEQIARRMSRSDREGAGYFSRSDVDACIRLVQSLWPAINARAEREMSLLMGAN